MLIFAILFVSLKNYFRFSKTRAHLKIEKFEHSEIAANFDLKTEFTLGADCATSNDTVSGTLSLLASTLKTVTLASPRLEATFDVDQREALGLRDDVAKIKTNLPDATTQASVDMRFNFTLSAASGNASAPWTWSAVTSGAALKLINATLDCDAKPPSWNTTARGQSSNATEVLTGGLSGKLSISDAVVTVRVAGDKLSSNTDAAAAVRDDAALTVTARGKLSGKLKLNVVNAKAVSQLKATLHVSDDNVFLSNSRNVDADDDGDARARVTLHVDFDDSSNRTIGAFAQAVTDINARAVSADLARSTIPFKSVGMNASEIAPLPLLGSSRAALNLSALFTTDSCFNSNATSSSAELTATLNSAACRALLVAAVNGTAADSKVSVKSVQLSWQPPRGLALRIDASIFVADFLTYAKNRSSVVASTRAFSASFAALDAATSSGRLLRNGAQYFRLGSSFVPPSNTLDIAQANLDFAFSISVIFLC